MPEDARVWMVRLGRGYAEDDVRGTLSLEADAVVFTEAISTLEHRFPLEHMDKPKRVRGSPILLVIQRANGELQRMAFYFSQPPPLRPPEPGSTSLPGRGIEARPMGAFGAVRRSSKRRHMRSNLGYLTTANASYKRVIQEWAAEIGAKIGAG
jgi:hypothetical protein